MQQHNFNSLIQEKEERFNMSKWEEVVPKYKFASPHYYREDHENEEFEKMI
jgi:hypothetical protein